MTAADDHGETPLHGAAYTGFLAVAKFLVEKGAKFDAQNMLGWTPLRIADGVPPLLATALAALALALRWQGADWPAQLFRIEVFRRLSMRTLGRQPCSTQNRSLATLSAGCATSTNGSHLMSMLSPRCAVM